VARHVRRSALAPVESSWRGGTRGVTEPLEPKEFGKRWLESSSPRRAAVLRHDSDVEEGLRCPTTIGGGGSWWPRRSGGARFVARGVGAPRGKAVRGGLDRPFMASGCARRERGTRREGPDQRRHTATEGGGYRCEL
jgi:hypothetical protein